MVLAVQRGDLLDTSGSFQALVHARLAGRGGARAALTDLKLDIPRLAAKKVVAENWGAEGEWISGSGG